MPPFIIRSAVLEDSLRLAELSDALGYPVGSDMLTQRLGRLIVRTENVVLVAVLASGQVAGWLHAAEEEPLEYRRRCEILGLVVDAALADWGWDVSSWRPRRGP